MAAMEDEMNSLIKNKTWSLITLPSGRKAIKNRWVFKLKLNSDNYIMKYKARLVAKGFTQKEGIDYSETFSPVVKYDSLRVILAIASQLDLEILQFNVKTAFLNGDLQEEIYMEQPEGFIAVGPDANKVCLFQRSLYGLKQA